MINDVLIVGGGTAGWLTAAILAKRLGADRPDGVKITLIESSEIGTIGVGEGTFPTMRRTMRLIGADEAEFMRECSAAFKQAIKFVDWEHPPANGRHKHYYHPFQLPHLMPMGMDMAPYWLMGAAGDGIIFSDAVTLQDKVVEQRRGPKRITDAPYDGPMNYAYHLDAAKLAAYLKKIAARAGVRHLVGNVERIEVDETGSISAVQTKEHGMLSAGLYVDCSGFSALLIGKTLGEPWRDISNILFVDRAIAMQVPYDRDDAPIFPATVSTAHESGWTWNIGLDTRRGTGYCYSSRHVDDDRAEEILRHYNGPAAENLSARRLRMPIGFRDKQWVKNCVAVGLSGGFLEPLESTGILQIEAAAHMIAEYFPRSGDDLALVARHFSHVMKRRYERAVDFIKMHFYLSKRRDNQFWIDNTDPHSATDSLLGSLELWRRRPPSFLDFDTTYESFKYQSWQYILLGMGFRPQIDDNRSAFPLVKEAAFEFRRVREAAQKAMQALPDHRALLDQIYREGYRDTKKSGATLRDREDGITASEAMHR